MRYSLVHINIVASLRFSAECLEILELFCSKMRMIDILVPHRECASTVLPSEGLGAMKLIR